MFWHAQNYLFLVTELIGPRPVYAEHVWRIIDIYHVRIPSWNPPGDIFNGESEICSPDTALIRKRRHYPHQFRLWILGSRSCSCAYQTLSDMTCSDILSLYKEELAGEASNYISLRAKKNKTTKLEELKNVVNDCLGAFRQIEQLAHDFRAVCGPSWPGYLRYHLSVPRYKLLELLDARNDF